MTLIIRNRIGFRIVVSFCALVLLLVGGGGWSLYRVAEAQFERQMADHLVSVSVLISEGLDGQVIEQVHPEYGLYGRIWSQLDKLRSRVGAARIVVFSREGNRLLDTRAKDAFGQPYTRLAFDQPEINAAWLGEPTHSVAFVNEAGATFQTGYAPLFRENAIVAVVAVDLGVGFVGAIEAFRGSVYILGMVGVLLTGVVGFALSRTLTKPIGHLVRHAQSIGEGDLEQEVVSASRDELGELARTL
ncbi:MAG: HAMP domain-containing protein, partial [bacterium]|nr:HAMP domain-containing protein [bacterium]